MCRRGRRVLAQQSHYGRKNIRSSYTTVRAVRVEARRPTGGALVRLLQFRVRTLVHVHARPPIVVQSETVRTHAKSRSYRIDALVRTSGRPVAAFVHVVAGVSVLS